MSDANIKASQGALNNIAMTVLFSIILGFTLQIITIATKMLGGMAFPGVAFALDIFGSVTWSVLVCVGIGLGTIVMRSGVAVAGILGAIFAPIGLVAAKSVQKGVALLLGMPVEGLTGAVIVLGLIKAVEYGFLGAMLAVLMKRDDHQFKRYVLLGLGTGIVFGSALVFASLRMAASSGAPLTSAQIAGKTVNEVLFPVGCAIVIYAIQIMSSHISVVKDES